MCNYENRTGNRFNTANLLPAQIAGADQEAIDSWTAPNAYQYAKDKAAARRNSNRTSLSTNDSARG